MVNVLLGVTEAIVLVSPTDSGPDQTLCRSLARPSPGRPTGGRVAEGHPVRDASAPFRRAVAPGQCERGAAASTSTPRAGQSGTRSGGLQPKTPVAQKAASERLPGRTQTGGSADQKLQLTEQPRQVHLREHSGGRRRFYWRIRRYMGVHRRRHFHRGRRGADDRAARTEVDEALLAPRRYVALKGRSERPANPRRFALHYRAVFAALCLLDC